MFKVILNYINTETPKPDIATKYEVFTTLKWLWTDILWCILEIVTVKLGVSNKPTSKKTKSKTKQNNNKKKTTNKQAKKTKTKQKQN